MGSHAGGALRNGLRALLGRNMRAMSDELCPLPCAGAAGRQPLHQEPNRPAFWSQTCSLQTGRNKLVLFEPLSLRRFCCSSPRRLRPGMVPWTQTSYICAAAVSSAASHLAQSHADSVKPALSPGPTVGSGAGTRRTTASPQSNTASRKTWIRV